MEELFNEGIKLTFENAEYLTNFISILKDLFSELNKSYTNKFIYKQEYCDTQYMDHFWLILINQKCKIIL